MDDFERKKTLVLKEKYLKNSIFQENILRNFFNAYAKSAINGPAIK